MPVVTVRELVEVQSDVERIRNVCIVAHVDHGKTTLTDCLISTNGIISQRSAGKLRYMDNMPCEQQRGITMKSSSIALLHEEGGARYLVNLVDSPGHVDFSGEVSSALRVTDGCFLLVDVIEGVCIQTRVVLRQAWKERVKPVLVINKLDKLWSLNLTVAEAYQRIVKVVEQVNEVVSALWMEQLLEEDAKVHGESGDGSGGSTRDEALSEERPDSADPFKGQVNSYFSPLCSNVLFASAAHRWAFSIDDFVELYAERLQINREALRRTLWGEHYFVPKKRKVVTKRPRDDAQTMFEMLVLSNLRKAYSIALDDAHVASSGKLGPRKQDRAPPAQRGDADQNRNKRQDDNSLNSSFEDRVEFICSHLGVRLSPHEIRPDDRLETLISVMSKWLPLSRTVLSASVRRLPSPSRAQSWRLECLWRPSIHDFTAEGLALQKRFRDSLLGCSRLPDAPTIAYVSKVFSLADDRRRPDSNRQKLVAVARLFSGRLRVGDRVHVLGPRYDPANPDAHRVEAVVPQLYMLMGPVVEPIQFADAGCIFGIGSKDVAAGTWKSKEFLAAPRTARPKLDQPARADPPTDSPLDENPRVVRPSPHPDQTPTEAHVDDSSSPTFVEHIVKTATLSSDPSLAPFGPLLRHANPIVRVAVEPKYPSQLPLLEKGLALLERSDASTEVYVQPNGEHIVGALGELHLERCLEQLREEFANIEIKVSPPLVSYRETVVWDLAREDVRLEALEPVKLWEGLEKEKLAKESDKHRFCLPGASSDRHVRAVVRAVPIPENLTRWLEEHQYETKIAQKIYGQNRARHRQRRGTHTTHDAPVSDGSETISRWALELLNELKSCSQSWADQANYIWALGPHHRGSNILLNNIPGYSTSTHWQGLLSHFVKDSTPKPNSNDTFCLTLSELEETVLSVFQIVTKSGTLCEEPMMGVAFQLLNLEILDQEPQPEDDPNAQPPSHPDDPLRFYFSFPAPSDDRPPAPPASHLLSDPTHFPPQSILPNSKHLSSTFSLLRTLFKASFSCRCRRLCEAYYLAHIQVSVSSLNKLHAVLGKRRGHVTSDRICEGTSTSIAEAYLPASEAFGFAEELTSKTGGAATAQLTFSHWGILDSDPDFVPTTDDELEEHGENLGGLSQNLAKICVDLVRKRKGLFVKEKLVAHANKQRTRSRKK
ncbi:elongation factor-like GTPase 1 [Schistocerca gregaria]|uniref:elongation factor-like GTPase 1 n=1 Tax=Schistocerca gregaria TaxID=7010 RepID=UPI00211EE821|nr:elongation factor-like GTPase 1 [Schistocerca gregaria]